MQTKRILTDSELKYVRQNLKNTKKQLFWLFVVLSVFIGGFAIIVYATEETNFVINLAFGMLILIIGFSYWLFKGYKNYELSPIVYSKKGFYKRIYESHSSKSGAYYDTINGIKVKLPWHWRNYLKKQKGEVDYQYILRDGAVAVNEFSVYVINVNDTLTLDYELNNGLEKLKPISLLNILSLFILPIFILLVCFENNLSNALKISETLKNPSEDTILLDNSEELLSLSTSHYIKIDSAWIYQYKPMSNTFGENYIVSNTERNRIYKHPSANMNYRFVVNSKYLTKPDKAKLKENFRNNPLSKNTLLGSTDSSIVNRVVEKVYKKQVEDYNRRLRQAEKVEQILEDLKPKSYILKISDDVFSAPEKRSYSILKSLEKPFAVQGFYDAKTKKLISYEQQKGKKKDIKSAFALVSVCGFILLLSIFSLVRIIKNSIVKRRLVKQQLYRNDLRQLN